MSIQSGFPPASLHRIIKDLFQNEQFKTTDFKAFTTLSKVNLTEDQKAQLTYPSGFLPLNIFLIEQNNQYPVVGEATVSQLLVSFIKKGNYIYGYYYDIIGQTPFDINELENSRKPISLLSTARFVPHLYLELYQRLNIGDERQTILLGLLSTENPAASLQYRRDCKFFLEFLRSNGLDENISTVRNLTGLSKNLQHIGC
jgi:hypothetical protein